MYLFKYSNTDTNSSLNFDNAKPALVNDRCRIQRNSLYQYFLELPTLVRISEQCAYLCQQ